MGLNPFFHKAHSFEQGTVNLETESIDVSILFSIRLIHSSLLEGKEKIEDIRSQSFFP